MIRYVHDTTQYFESVFPKIYEKGVKTNISMTL